MMFALLLVAFASPVVGQLDPMQESALLAFLDGIGCDSAICSRSQPCGSGIQCSGRDVTRIDMSSRGLSGTITSAISAFTALSYFVLHSNSLHGSIPPLDSLTSLEVLYLGHNNLEGTLPSFELLTRLERLNLPDNSFSGTIPPLAALTRLGHLYLNCNLLSGTVPQLPPAGVCQVTEPRCEKHNNCFSDGCPTTGGCSANCVANSSCAVASFSSAESTTLAAPGTTAASSALTTIANSTSQASRSTQLVEDGSTTSISGTASASSQTALPVASPVATQLQSFSSDFWMASDRDNESLIDVGIAAGIAVGVAICLLAFGVLLFVVWKYRHSKGDNARVVNGDNSVRRSGVGADFAIARYQSRESNTQAIYVDRASELVLAGGGGHYTEVGDLLENASERNDDEHAYHDPPLARHVFNNPNV